MSSIREIIAVVSSGFPQDFLPELLPYPLGAQFFSVRQQLAFSVPLVSGDPSLDHEAVAMA